MKGKTNPTATVVQVDAAREMMNKGQSREALMKAMSALLQALNTLRGSLLSLQDGLSARQEFLPLASAPAPAKVAAPRLPLIPKPRILQ